LVAGNRASHPTEITMYPEIRTECERLGLTIVSVEQSKHCKITLTNEHGLTRKLITPVSPSDSRRGWINCRADLRRFARLTSQDAGR
jgi:hypothetical protein